MIAAWMGLGEGMGVRQHGAMKRAAVYSVLCAFALVLAACGSVAVDAPLPRAWPEAERVFHADPRWLGGDAAISVALDEGRVLWLFGDSFVDPVAPYARREAAFLRNSVGVESGHDPLRDAMQFVWRADENGEPRSFLPEDGADWFWPAGGMRLESGAVALFFHRVAATAEKSALGFVAKGFALVVVDNPDASPGAWRMRRFDAKGMPFGALPGSAMVREGGFVVTLATRQTGAHAGMLVRYREADLARGDLSRAQWWSGAAWMSAARIGAAGPAIVIDDAGAESSLHYDACAKAWVHVSSAGFGATDIVERTAPALTGPWSAPHVIYRPPESDRPKPFVYAGKAHAEVATPDGRAVAVSYVASSFESEALTAPGGEALYWPRMALVAARDCAAR